ncbi:MAG: diguanylate cyclase domain-containing protein [Geodermatophilaceae bacterium]
MNTEIDDGQANAGSVAAAVATTALVEAEVAAQAVIETQAAVLAAARVLTEAAAAAARAVTAAVEAKAAVVSAAAAASAEARRTEARLTHEVLHDGLTGLAHRRLLLDRLTQALARSARTGMSVAVLFLDLDHFKIVNDTLGHAAGDQLLVGVARRLQECVRDTDTCARVGGDEFVVVCEDLSQPSDGSLVAGRVKSALAAGVPVGDQTLPVRASIGIAVSAVGSQPLDLLQEADTAMYRIKVTTKRDQRRRLGPDFARARPNQARWPERRRSQGPS